MLLTTCPNCSAQFKVQTEQLNVRQGRVMCGRCRQVFDAFQSLTRGPDTTGPHIPLDDEALASAGDVASTATNAPSRQRDFPAPGVTSTLAIPEADASAILLEDVDASDAPGHLAITSDQAGAAPVSVDASVGNDNPLLVAAGPRHPVPPPRTAPWVVGALFLGVGLVAQALYVFRADIANSVPETRPFLLKACATLGCDVPFGRDEAVVKIEASDLVEIPGKSARIQVTATLANRGRATQDYPMLELRLTDNANQVLLSRALQPADYLGRPPARDEGIAPGAEVFVNLYAELGGKLPASGYAVRAFYP